MDRIRTLLCRIFAFFRTRSLDACLDEELRGHIELTVKDHMRSGIPEPEARRLALSEFGGVTQAREAYRVQRGLPWIEQLRRDVRFGIFQLWKSPGFTLTSILTLALGVGANTTVFSMINGLLLRPLPVPESGRLIVLGINIGGSKPNFGFSEPLYRGLESRRGALSTVFAFDRSPFQVKTGASTEVFLANTSAGLSLPRSRPPPYWAALSARRMIAREETPPVLPPSSARLSGPIASTATLTS